MKSLLLVLFFLCCGFAYGAGQCDGEITMTSETDLGNGQWEYEFLVCPQINHAGVSTDEMNITFYPASINILTYVVDGTSEIAPSRAYFTASNGDDWYGFRDANYGDNSFTFINTEVYPSTSSNFCITVTIVTDARMDKVFAAESNYAGCDFSSTENGYDCIVGDCWGNGPIGENTDNPPPPTCSINATSDSKCDEGGSQATFNLTVLNATVAGDSINAYTIKWYRDAGLSNEITGASLTAYLTASTTVYVQITSILTGCQSDEAVSLTVTTDVAAQNAEVFACGSSTGTFDLTEAYLDIYATYQSSADIYLYTASDHSIGSLITGINLTNFTSGETTIYAEVEDYNGCKGYSEVTLTLQSINVQNASGNECGVNGTATFDLSDYEANLFPGNGAGDNFYYYSDANRTIEITGSDITAYVTGATSVYVKVVDSEGCEGVSTLTLTVDAITANDVSDSACEDVEGTGAATFDLTFLNTSIGGGNTVSWYEDAGTSTNPINPANAYVSSSKPIYAFVVDDGNNCTATATITLTVDSKPTAVDTDYKLCDDGSGTAVFDLSSTETTVTGGAAGVTVTWWEDASTNLTAIVGGNITSYTSSSKNVYALIDNGSCTDVAVVALIPSPLSANSALLNNCGDGGVATFDLEAADLGTGSNDYKIEWFTNITVSDPITDPSAYLSGATIVYALVQDTTMNPICSEIVDVTLNIDGITAIDTTLEICGIELESGLQATIDLSDYNGTVSGGSANNVTWWEDAGATTTQITPTTGYVVVTGKIVYAKVSDGASCEDIAQIGFSLNPIPFLVNNITIDACGDDNGFASYNLASIESSVYNNANDMNIEWFADDILLLPVGNSSGHVTSALQVYAYVTDTLTLCYDTVPVNTNAIIVSAYDSYSFTACDDGSGNGTGLFDLTTGAVTTDLTATVTWHTATPLDVSTQIIPDDAFISIDATIFALVTETTSGLGCSRSSLGILNVGPIVANDRELEGCDNGNGNGNALYDLTSMDQAISGNNNTVTYYPTLNDAQSETNAILNPTTYLTGAGAVWAIVTQSANCKSLAATLTLNMHDKPVINYDFDETSKCQDENGVAIFDLSSISTGAGQTSWYEYSDFGNAIAGSSLTAFTVTPPSHILSFILTDNNNCTDTSQLLLDVLIAPEIDSIGYFLCDGDGSGDESFNLTLINDSIGGSLDVIWYTDDTYTTPVFSETNFVGGNEYVYAEITNNNGCSDASPIYIGLTEEDLEIEFVVAPCINNRTAFSLNYSGSLDSAKWVFGDGDSVVNFEDTVGHQYSKKGSNQVDLLVYDGVCVFTTQTNITLDGKFSINAAGRKTIFLGQTAELSTNNDTDAHLWSGDNSIDDIESKNPIVRPSETTIYEVTVTNDKGCYDTDSVTIHVNEGKEFMIPSSFTPNGDGLNDLFNIPNEGICSMEMVIYNRWGHVVATITDPNQGWNGVDHRNGKAQPVDSYAFSLVINFCDGTSTMDGADGPINGMVHLLR